MRIAVPASVVFLCAACSATPVERVSAMAWLGGWEALRAPSVAIPESDGTTSGDLDGAFRVEWTRQGDELRARVTRLNDEWVGRLALEIRFATDSSELVWGCHDAPVRVPLERAEEGQILWVWSYDVPSWILADGAGAAIHTPRTHGYFLDRYPDGTVVAHIGSDWPKAVGESMEMSLRLVEHATPLELQAERRRGLGAEVDPPLDTARIAQLASAGSVRVDRSGTGFETTDGQPFRVLGMNTPHLAELSPAEQERILQESEACGVNVTRFLVPDYLHRPLGVANEDAYARLLATVERCASHGIRSVVCLEYSGCGQQYNLTIHRTKNWSDLYLMPEALAWYGDTVERIVRPLRGNPAVFGYDVSNEPDMALTPGTPTQLAAWRGWLARRYDTVEALRAAWSRPDLAGLEQADVPSQEDYDWQRSPEARDWLEFAGESVGRAMVARAQLVRAEDSDHLLTVSAWNPRLLRGLEGAEAFDYWAPHSYEIYFVGPEIGDQVAYQVGLLRRALPDRPRPVVIEEFGLLEEPQFPEPMRAEHCRAFLEAGDRWGVGMMMWYDLTPSLRAEFARAQALSTAPSWEGGDLVAYVPRSEECRGSVYGMYMWRRKWGLALATASDAGLTMRELVTPGDAAGARAVLLLGDAVSEEDEATLRATGLPIVLLPGADGARERFLEATQLPAGRAEQVEVWRGIGR